MLICAHELAFAVASILSFVHCQLHTYIIMHVPTRDPTLAELGLWIEIDFNSVAFKIRLNSSCSVCPLMSSRRHYSYIRWCVYNFAHTSVDVYTTLLIHPLMWIQHCSYLSQSVPVYVNTLDYQISLILFDTVGRVVTCYIRWPEFEYRHHTFLALNHC